jgi:hypothetical protein
MKALSLIVFLIGVYMIGFGYMQQKGTQCKNKVEYRFVPRSVYDQMLFEDDLTQKYENMFSIDPYNPDTISLEGNQLRNKI